MSHRLADLEGVRAALARDAIARMRAAVASIESAIRETEAHADGGTGGLCDAVEACMRAQRFMGHLTALNTQIANLRGKS